MALLRHHFSISLTSDRFHSCRLRPFEARPKLGVRRYRNERGDVITQPQRPGVEPCRNDLQAQAGILSFAGEPCPRLRPDVHHPEITELKLPKTLHQELESARVLYVV